METLRLKTVLTLVLEDYPDSNLKWCEERDVQFMVRSPLQDDHPMCGEARALTELIAIWYTRQQGNSPHTLPSAREHDTDTDMLEGTIR